MPFTDPPRRHRPSDDASARTRSSISSRRSRVRFAIEQGDSSGEKTSKATEKGSIRDTLVELPHLRYDDEQYSLSSYRHPDDISRPQHAFNGVNSPFSAPLPEKENQVDVSDLERGPDERRAHITPEDGYLSHFVNYDDDNNWDNLKEQQPLENGNEEEHGDDLYEQVVDVDDPRITHERKQYLDDYEDLEEFAQKQMSYKERRKVARAVRIQFNISCEHHRLSCTFSAIIAHN
jgi:hypothetical protein